MHCANANACTRVLEMSWARAAGFASRYGGSVNWFPGHMAKTAKVLESHASACDVVIEVRDARVPFTSGNPMLGTGRGATSLSTKPRIVVLNKADLANDQLQGRVLATLAAQGHEGVFLSADGRRGGRPHVGVSRLLALVDAVRTPASKFNAVGAVMLVVGIPNVGKSSLINAVRTVTGMGGAAASTAPTPGHTRHVTALRVRHTPALYLFDSPGVLMPRIPDVESGLKLAVTTAVREAAVPPVVQAEYLLYLFASMGTTRYVQGLGLPRPYSEDEVEEALAHIATASGSMLPGGKPDLNAAARRMIRAFQDGSLGRYTLDYVDGGVTM
jgi:ribosome biogenesis GTPase A